MTAIQPPRKRGRPPKRAATYTPTMTAVDVEEAPIALEVPDAEMEVVLDPFSSQNFLEFKKHPDGFVLRFCNPNYRAHRGYRGWEPVRWSSEIGQNLGEFLIDPPFRFKAMNELDDFIRVGNDLVLCKLPTAIYAARRRAIQSKRDNIMGQIQLADPEAPAPDAEYDQVGGKTLRGIVTPPKSRQGQPVVKTRIRGKA